MDDQTFSFSVAIEHVPQINIPISWVKCPRKSTLIVDKFFAFKTPLDQRFKTYLEAGDQWTCTMLVQSIKNLGLVIDLTDTEQYYIGTDTFQRKNVYYEKLACRDGQLPSNEKVEKFIEICDRFISTHPDAIIGVHCVYGFNQTGYLICTYLCRKLNYNIHEAITIFANARSPGIKKQNFINALIEKFAPNDTSIDVHRPAFAIEHHDIIPICSPVLLDYFRLNYQQLSNSNLPFPTRKPTLLTDKNYQTIFLTPYIVTAMTAGIRYLLLIDNENEVYLLDQNQNIFQVNHLNFPHSSNTLLDGEFLVENVNGNRIYRYLVFDILIYKNDNVSEHTFSERLQILDKDIIQTRNQYFEDDVSMQSRQVFPVERKEFFELSQILQVFDKYNGFIFQSNSSVNKNSSFKWKKHKTLNFRLKTSSRTNRVDLFLKNSDNVYATIPYSQFFDQYNNHIIECLYFNHQWHFNRFRPDRKHPDQNGGQDNQSLSCNSLHFFLEEKLAFDNL